MKTNNTATIDSDEKVRRDVAIRNRLQEVVDKFEGWGWEVHADLPGRKKPEPVRGEVPDVVALKDCRRIFTMVAIRDMLMDPGVQLQDARSLCKGTRTTNAL